MRRSADRILTTHTGSLPRPADLDQLLAERDSGKKVDQAAFDARVRQAVEEVVKQQLRAGVTVVGDGEMGKSGYSTYVKERLTGFGGTGIPIASTEMIEYPEVFESIAARRGSGARAQPARLYRPRKPGGSGCGQPGHRQPDGERGWSRASRRVHDRSIAWRDRRFPDQ